jgi:cell division protein FtsQ
MSSMSLRHEDFVRAEDALPPRRASRAVLLVAVLTVVGSLASLALERWAASDPFPLRAVRFDGDLGHVQESDLRTAVSAHLDGGLLTVNVAEVRRAVEAMPWVASASVRRVWPDALRITVTEQVPVARWGEDGLINATAGVFYPQRLPAGLPRLSGPAGTEAEVLNMYRWLQQRLDVFGSRIESLRLDARRAWQVALAGGTALVLGREHIVERVERLLAAWPRLDTAGRRPAVIDLRYPNGFAVRWEPAQDTANQRSEGTEGQ